MKPIWAFSLIALLFLAGCVVNIKTDYKGYYNDTYEYNDGYMDTGDSYEEEYKRILDTSPVKGKEIIVTFTTVTKPNVKPSIKREWYAYYNFKKDPPEFKIEINVSCYNEPNCDQYYKKRYIFDFTNWQFLTCRMDNCTSDRSFYTTDPEDQARMFGMIYEDDGTFEDISDNGPLMTKELMKNLKYEGETNYKGLNVKVYKDLFGKAYVYQDLYIVGKDKALVQTPLTEGIVTIVNGSISITIK